MSWRDLIAQDKKASQSIIGRATGSSLNSLIGATSPGSTANTVGPTRGQYSFAPGSSGAQLSRFPDLSAVNTIDRGATASGPRPGSVFDRVTRPVKESTTTPVQTTPTPPGPVEETVPEEIIPTPTPSSSAPAPAPAPEPTPYNVYDDPNYQAALAAAQSQFNLERIGALGAKQYQDLAIERTLENRPDIAEGQRRRLAGNFAARGMAGGRYGALTRAEAELNAQELAQRTGLREQMAELDRQFTSQFGAEGTDWLGTLRGQQAQQNAIQQALAARLGGLTTV